MELNEVPVTVENTKNCLDSFRMVFDYLDCFKTGKATLVTDMGNLKVIDQDYGYRAEMNETIVFLPEGKETAVSMIYGEAISGNLLSE